MGRAKRTPLFRLLEAYVLDAIGALPPEEAGEAAKLVKAVFKTTGDWRAVLDEQFGLEATVRDHLNAMWTQSQTVAVEQQASLSARDFATLVVEENFADMLEMLATELARPHERD